MHRYIGVCLPSPLRPVPKPPGGGGGIGAPGNGGGGGAPGKGGGAGILDILGGGGGGGGGGGVGCRREANRAY